MPKYLKYPPNPNIDQFCWWYGKYNLQKHRKEHYLKREKVKKQIPKFFIKEKYLIYFRNL